MSITVDGQEIDYSGLPERHRETVRMYIEHGLEPGSGWRAILANDLSAVVRCDQETVKELPQIWRWIHNHAPGECHGSYVMVDLWCERQRNEWRNTHVVEPMRGVVNSISADLT